ncbi:MAG: DUF4105 domain-containing protein [Deltaproteobacteria bacterium]|nr:MAG: DUF4105 domain-containing protein [Deltaproteobacteria bacterium]
MTTRLHHQGTLAASARASGPTTATGWVLRALFALVAFPIALWGALALHFAGPRSAATVLPVVWAVGAFAILLFVGPFARRAVVFALAAAALFAWWSTIRPSNDRQWQPDVAQPPHAQLHGDELTIHNVRNFDYRTETDFSERWETRTYDLAKLDRLDFFMSYWGSPAIAHTIMSWAFTDGQHLAISIETRKEVGETYSTVAGFFRQYELYYVAADERDVIRVRTNYRGEDVYLYPLRTPRDRVRRALLEYAESMNRLAVVPEFYNEGTGNCTTTIRTNLEHMGISMPLDWRLLVNGYLNELLYEKNVIDTSRPLDVVKASSLIDARAKAADQAPDFSSRIREGIVVPLRFDQPGAPPQPR